MARLSYGNGGFDPDKPLTAGCAVGAMFGSVCGVLIFTWMFAETALARSPMKPSFMVLAFVSAYLLYLGLLWRIHRRLDRLSLYFLLALGGAAIPLAVSTYHYGTYNRTPEAYAVSEEALPYLRRLGANMFRQRQSELAALLASKQLILDLNARRPHLPSRLRLVDGRPGFNCTRIYLGADTGAVCIRQTLHVNTNTGREWQVPVSDQFEVRLNAGWRQNGQGLELVNRPYGGACYNFAANASNNGGRQGADREQLFHCLGVSHHQIDLLISDRRRQVDADKTHPYIPYRVMFLDTFGGLVDADFSAVEPISERAAAMTIAGAFLTLVYFGVFASVILEAVTKKASGASRENAPAPRPGCQ